MSIELHFIAVPREGFLATRTSVAFEDLFFLSDVEIPDPPDEEALLERLTDEVKEEEHHEVIVGHLLYLISKGAIPQDTLDLHRSAYGPLREIFEEAPTVFGKCFEGGEAVGKEFDAIWGEDVALISAGLGELDVGEEDEELMGPVEWLRELYAKAAANDWVLVRYWA